MRYLSVLVLLCVAACSHKLVTRDDRVVSVVKPASVIVENQEQMIESDVDRSSVTDDGLIVFVCLCGVLLTIVMITMGYTKIVTPKQTTITRSDKQIIQDHMQHK